MKEQIGLFFNLDIFVLFVKYSVHDEYWFRQYLFHFTENQWEHIPEVRVIIRTEVLLGEDLPKQDLRETNSSDLEAVVNRCVLSWGFELSLFSK